MFTVLRNGSRTEYADLLDLLEEATAEDPVYVANRGWMTVGDLRWGMAPGLAGDTPAHYDLLG